MRPGALKMLAEEVKRAIDVIDRPYTNESDPYKGWSRLRQNAHAEMLRSKSRELAEEVIAAVERLEQRTT